LAITITTPLGIALIVPWIAATIQERRIARKSST
jgi:hypothetical protein